MALSDLEMTMKNENGSSRLDAVLKMLLIAFISLLAFSSGVYFGKQMSDSDYQLKALEGDFGNAKKTAENNKEGKEHAANGDEALVDEEVAQLTDKYLKAEKAGQDGATPQEDAAENHERKVASTDDGHGEKPAQAPAAPAAARDGHQQAQPQPVKAAHAESHAAAAAKPDLGAAHQAANRVANNHAPSETTKPQPETRNPTSLPKVVGASNDVEFTVQVASYPTAEAAKEHAQELVKKGFPAFPVEASVSGRVWYRVSVGSFKSLKEATVYRAQLLKQADVPSALVQRIQR
jgi:cell division septation protein DedD